jgi:hypothetical protein
VFPGLLLVQQEFTLRPRLRLKRMFYTVPDDSMSPDFAKLFLYNGTLCSQNLCMNCAVLIRKWEKCNGEREEGMKLGGEEGRLLPGYMDAI